MNEALNEAYEHSPVRNNLLNWFDFNENGSVFFPIAPAQSIADYMRAKVKAVYIGADEDVHAHKVGDLDALEDRRYDYVIVIEDICSNERPDVSADAISKYHDMLKPGGTLFLAMNNAFGLRYFSGVSEEHSGKAYGAIEGLTDKNGRAGLTRDELLSVFRQTDFYAPFFYYPFPDFVFPTEIFSDEHLPKPGDITGIGREYQNDEDAPVNFAEEQVWMRICKAGKFQDFANSFLVLAERRA